MNKNRKNRKKDCVLPPLPPEGLWVGPDGLQYPISEHLFSLAENPEQFGISPEEVRGADIHGLRNVAEGLIAKGWTRYRYLNGRYHFEVDDACLATGLIEDVLAAAQAIPQEEVWISEASGKEYQGKVEDLPDGAIFRIPGKPQPNRWRFSRADRVAITATN